MVRQKQDGVLPDLGTRWPGPVHEEGPAEPGMLRARHHSAAAGGHVPLPTQDLSPALPCPVTHPSVLWLCTHGVPMCWSFLNAVHESRQWGGICSHIQHPTHTFGSQILNCTPAICEAPLSLNSQAFKLGPDTPRARAQFGLTGLMHVTRASSSSYTRWKPSRSLTRTAVKINGIFLPWGHCLE